MSSQLDLRTVLVRMLELEDEDAQLPLAVLVNLHRTQLRVPLEVLLERARAEHALLAPDDDQPEPLTAEQAWLRVETQLETDYPALFNGSVFDSSRELIAMPVGYEAVSLSEGCPELAARGYLTHVLIERHNENWYPHESAVMLHRLTWQQGAAHRGEILDLLELELSLHDEVGQLLLDLYAIGGKA